MTYSIKYRQTAGAVASEHWVETLIEAKEHAINAVTSGAAERAEIRDSAGKLVFHHPRALRRS